MDIYLKDLSKILATYTRGWLDSPQWRKILRIIPKGIGSELAKDNRVHAPFGEYYRSENTQKVIKKSIDGRTNVPINNKYRAVCSCARHFEEIINSDTRK